MGSMSNRVGICVGGPLDGEPLEAAADVVTLAEAPGMAYHWTRDRVWEWHEYEWVSPEVEAIREAVRRA